MPDSVAATPPNVSPPRVRPAADSAAGPPISPRTAFLSSVLLPGYGQSRLDRGNAGALFVLAEAISLAMIRKSAADLRIARAFENDSIVVGYTTNQGSLVVPDPTDPAGGSVTLRCFGGLAAGFRPTGSTQVVNGSARPVYAIACPTRFTTRLVNARRTHVEDWVALLIFNHLLAGADAYVAAHLWDLPGRMALAPADGGGLTLSAQLRW